jgi:hypothetical protein
MVKGAPLQVDGSNFNEKICDWNSIQDECRKVPWLIQVTEGLYLGYGYDLRQLS